MGLSEAERLGTILGTQARKADDYKQDFIENDSVEDFTIITVENVEVSEVIIVTGKYYASSSFILDHPVQGELDSSTFALDGGYAAGLETTILDSRL